MPYKEPTSEPDAFARFQGARETMEAAYNRLSLVEKLRADQSTFIAGAVSFGLGVFFRPDSYLFSGRWVISDAFAQTAIGRLSGSLPPIEITYIVYLSLILLLMASFYLGAFKGSQSAYVRDTWKTLLGFFIGVVTR
jgi:hypothetical protein